MSWIIGDVKVKKFNMIDHNNEGNIFVFGKEMFSPNNIEHISTFSAYFIESNYAKSINKVLLLDSNDNVLTELTFDTAEIIEKSNSDDEYIFGNTKVDKVKYVARIKDKVMKY